MATEEADFVISIRDLVVGFGSQIVLNHLSLDVRRGEILGLVGASGGGKSVLLRAIIGLIPKRHGRIEVEGIDRDTATPEETRALERRWGVLFQQGAMFSSLTVLGKYSVPDARKSSPLRALIRRTRQCQAGNGWLKPERRQEISG